MRSKRETNESLRQLHVKASGNLDQRVHGAIDKALADKQTNTAPEKGRIIMIGSFAKLAVAAGVVLAVMLGLNIVSLPHAGGVAWAQIPERIAAIDTFIFSLTIRAGQDEAAQLTGPPTAQWVFYLSEEYGFRMDIVAEGNVTSWYVAPEAETMITVVPGEKMWFSSPVPQDDTMPDDYRDPAEYITRFLARPYTELGRSTIDGVEVEGIEVTDPPTDGEKLEDGVGRMWVDVKTELPVRIEIEGTADGQPVQWQMDFKWSEMVAPAVFEPNIPADYTTPLQ